jgi:hypothetical protein
LGLDYVIENLRNGTISREEAIELLIDAKSSCSIATDTMNEFLLIDKIESCMIVLEQELTNVWSFVNKSFSPFKLQVSGFFYS